MPYAHKDLAAGLDLSGYSNELHEVLSVQHCGVRQSPTTSSSSSSRSTAATTTSSSSHSSSRGRGKGSCSNVEDSKQVHPDMQAGADAPSAAGPAAGGAGLSAPVLDRLAGGRPAAYAFVYPNLMINRYG